MFSSRVGEGLMIVGKEELDGLGHRSGYVPIRSRIFSATERVNGHKEWRFLFRGADNYVE